jgi:hypothetical protein
MFQGWHDYFFLVGSAAAGLIGLLFVVATLNAGRDATSFERGARVYLTPVVLHLSTALVVSALALAANLPAAVCLALFGACALAGLICSGAIALQLRWRPMPEAAHWTDFWFYAVAPGLCYLALAAAAGSAWLQPEATPYWTAFALLALLMSAIRNAWDLVTWLAPRRVK